MPGYANWSKGFGNEYEVVEQSLLGVGIPPAEQRHRWEDFVQRIRTQGDSLLVAHSEAFYGGPPHPKLEATGGTWFGDGGPPMWLWDCTLTLGQIHQVMRETRVRVAELLLVGATDVEFWVQCSYARFHTFVTWPSATGDDARPAGSDGWAPSTDVTGQTVRVWVRTPFNAGYLRADESDPEAEPLRQELIDRLEGLRPEHFVAERGTDFMTVADVEAVAGLWRWGRCLYRKTPLATASDPALPDPAGLEIVYHPTIAQPTPSFLRRSPRHIAPVETPGIEISWPGAGDGRLLRYRLDDISRRGFVGEPAPPVEAAATRS